MRAPSLLVLGLTLACASCRSGAEEGSEDELAAPDPVPAPRFTDPSNLSKVIRADRDEPIELGIADARDDLWIEIDGHVIEPSPGGVVERIADDRLQLRVEGSMVALLHDVVLAQHDGQDIVRSESLTLGIVGSELDPIHAELEQDLGPAEHVGARGVAEQALLGQLVGDTLTLHRGQPPSVIASLELPEISTAPHSWTAIFEAEVPWIAWRVATPKGDTAIRMRLGESGEVQTVWRSDDPQSVSLFGTHEYASLDAVAWIGRTLMISSQSIRDVERATPGDRVLLLRRVDPSGELFDPQIVRGQGQRDIDSLTAILDLAPDSEPRMLVRLARALPWSLGLSTSGLAVIDEEPDAIELAADLRWLGGIDGAFGSRQAFWLADDGLRLGVVLIDRSLDRTDAGEVELLGAPSGPPALAVLGGVPTIVIPRGDQPVQVVRSTGAELELTELLGTSCDEVALLVSLEASQAGTLPFACLSAGTLLLGTLAQE